MFRWFSGEVTETLSVKATDLKEGDMVGNEEVDYIETDLGMVVIYYKSERTAICDKREYFQVVRRYQK